MGNAKHTIESTMADLARAAYAVLEVRDVDHGMQLRLAGGGLVTVYRTGTRLAQGKGADAIRASLAAAPDAAAAEPEEDDAWRRDSFVTTPEMIGALLARMDAAGIPPCPDSRPCITAGPHDLTQPPF